MTLSLPEDLEPYLENGFDQCHSAGVYALDLKRPDDLAEAWDREFETRPDYWAPLTDSSEVIYVGATADVLSRLEEHRDGNVRRAALVSVCEITDIRGVWWFDAVDRAFEREHGIAMSINNAVPSAYVHAR